MMRVNEKGTILISMLMLLVIVTIMAVIALSMTSVELQVMGNLKKTERTLNAAEGGIGLSHSVIEATLQAGQLAPSSIAGVGIDVMSSGTRSYSLAMKYSGKQNYYSDTNYDPNPANMQPNLTIRVRWHWCMLISTGCIPPLFRGLRWSSRPRTTASGSLQAAAAR